MPDVLGLVLAIAAKDIRAELRSRTALLSAVVFAALVLVIFNFARDPTAVASVAKRASSSRPAWAPVRIILRATVRSRRTCLAL